MADVATERMRLGETDIGWPLQEMWITGELPMTWPVWNHEHRRLVRFWSASGDLHLAVVDALGSGRPPATSILPWSTHSDHGGSIE